MTLHKLTAGDGYTYLTRQVAASDATNRGYSDLGAYYSEKGEAPGVWMGLGNRYRIHEQANMQGLHADTPVPAEVRAQIRSDIAPATG